MDSVSLKAEYVKTSYGRFSVSGIDFELSQGDIMGLVGRSGSGKSTLIKTLVGLKSPDRGRFKVVYQEKDADMSTMIGYSPQENSLYPFLTIEENIITFGKLHKVDRTEIQKKMNFLLNRLDLAYARRKRINQLSGGMQKRADLAVTLIHSPKIIVLDEPFTGLDVSLQRFIWDLLLDLSKSGRIIIISSHMLNDIQTNCNKFGLIERGTFYSTEQILKSLNGKKQSLRSFLEKRFTDDLLSKK